MIELLTNFIIALIKATGYPGVFLLMTLESALIPIPSEATMPFAGSLVAFGTFNFWWLVIIGTAGNLLGSVLAYGLGYLGENEVASFIRRYGKYVLIREKEFQHARVLFKRFGEPIVFLSRILPAVRTYISLPAGIAKMDFKKFLIYTCLGSFIWSAVLTYLGMMLRNNWHVITPYFHILDILVIGSMILGVGYFLQAKLSKRT